jgi:hypothetical protein
MDRTNWIPCNSDYYSYNQTHQEGAQHASQPEAGQTSFGVPASGASWSHPAYLNPNTPVQIPSSPGADLEYFLQTFQPTILDEITQPEAGQTSAGVPTSGMSWSHPAHLNPNMPALIPSSPGQDLEYFLRTFQPTILDEITQSEAGQTSAEVPAIGASGSHPAHLNPNMPARIPSSPGLDLEYLLRTPQPATLEGIIQNDAPPEVANSQLPVKNWLWTKEAFLAGLKAFGQGAPMINCSSSIRFSDYIKSNGEITKFGISLHKLLTEEEKTLLKEAIIDRQDAKLIRLADKDTVAERLLEGLDKYARGVPLRECSATLSFRTYVTDSGGLHKSGKKLLSSLSQEDRMLVNQALASRNAFYRNKWPTPNDPAAERFLAGLDKYEQGAKLVDCSATISFGFYVTDDGRLRQCGERLRANMSEKDQARVNQALAARKEGVAQRASEEMDQFMTAIEPYANGRPLRECGNQSGLKRKLVTYLSPEGGLRPKGQQLFEKMQPSQRDEVLDAIAKRQRHPKSTKSSQQLPEMPSSMPEMPGINQAAMANSVQMEAMRAAVWQLTGQAAPGPS